MFCKKCGAKLQDGAKFCQKCGTPTVLPPTETPVSQWEQPVHPGPSEPRAVPPAPVLLQQPYAARPFQSPQGRQEASQIPHVPVQPGNPQTTPPQPGGHPGFVPPGIPPKKKPARWPWVVCGIFIAIVGLMVVSAMSNSVEQPSEETEPSSSQSEETALVETYTNQAEGLSFQYPAGWISVSEEEAADYYESFSPENPPIVLLATEEDGDLISTIDVFKYAATQEDVDWLYSSDEEFAETVPNVTWIETSLTELDGVSVRELLTINGDELYSRSYLYLSGAYLYEIRFGCHESYRNDMDPIYDEVLHSCVLTIDQVNIPTSPSPDDLPEGLAWVEKPNVVTDNWGFRSITGILENTSSVTYESLFIQFNLYDASGNQIGTASDLLSNLQAGGTWKFEAGILDEDAVRFELVSVSFQS